MIFAGRVPTTRKASGRKIEKETRNRAHFFLTVLRHRLCKRSTDMYRQLGTNCLVFKQLLAKKNYVYELHRRDVQAPV
jgi:hypothetical protein